MPRRAAHNSEESPVPRRTSARIAAVQAASPAKSPVKSPRRKRQSTEATKAVSEDTESQQSQLKSEVSMEDLNGIETNSSTKDRDSVVDSEEIPPKKTKIDAQPIEETSGDLTVTNQEKVETVQHTETPVSTGAESIDFEVVEKTDVPPADSAEVKAAVSVQGEDGQLLVGFVQVDKDELPSATSLEVKHVTSEQPESRSMEDSSDNADTHTVNPVNGDREHPTSDIPPAVTDEVDDTLSARKETDELMSVETEKHRILIESPEVTHKPLPQQHEDLVVQSTTMDAAADPPAPMHSEHIGLSDTVMPLEEQTEPAPQSKLSTNMESIVQSSLTPASGDGTVVDAISLETIPQ